MILGIDSSDEFLSVGVFADSGIVVSRATGLDARKNILHRFMMETLEQGNIGMPDINGAAVAIGPGSFTGLRVGLAAAKGICWPANLPLAGVSSLHALAACVGSDFSEYLAVKDAKKGEFYYAGFSKSGDTVSRLLPDSVGEPGQIEKLVDNGYSLSGPGVRVIMDRHLLNREPVLLDFDRNSLGGVVARIGRDMIKTGRVLDLASAAPVYIRTPQYAKNGVR